MHRFTWDVHYQPLPAVGAGGRGGLPIAAVPNNTVMPPTTPWVGPGTYTVRLTVNGESYTQPITVKADPRVKTPVLVMQQVYALSKAMYFEAMDLQTAAARLAALRRQAADKLAAAQGAEARALEEFDRKAEALQLPAAGASLAGAMNLLQAADVQPTAVQLATVSRARRAAARALAGWQALEATFPGRR